MNLCINDFEGPLDLLLHLVKTSKMDIYENDVKYIIDKYLEKFQKKIDFYLQPKILQFLQLTVMILMNLI